MRESARMLQHITERSSPHLPHTHFLAKVFFIVVKTSRPHNVSKAWNKIYALMSRFPLLIPNICYELVRKETYPRQKKLWWYKMPLFLFIKCFITCVPLILAKKKELSLQFFFGSHSQKSQLRS